MGEAEEAEEASETEEADGAEAAEGADGVGIRCGGPRRPSGLRLPDDVNAERRTAFDAEEEEAAAEEDEEEDEDEEEAEEITLFAALPNADGFMPPARNACAAEPPLDFAGAERGTERCTERGGAAQLCICLGLLGPSLPLSSKQGACNSSSSSSLLPPRPSLPVLSVRSVSSLSSLMLCVAASCMRSFRDTAERGSRWMDGGPTSCGDGVLQYSTPLPPPPCNLPPKGRMRATLAAPPESKRPRFPPADPRPLPPLPPPLPPPLQAPLEPRLPLAPAAAA